MKMVVGGAYQGKQAYARETWHLEEGWADGATCSWEELGSCRGVSRFHAYIRRLVQGDESALPEGTAAKEWQGKDLSALERTAKAFAERLARENPELVVVMDELGCGVVPLEPEDRLWRELSGRVGICLAARAETVVRVLCGIGTAIKGQ